MKEYLQKDGTSAMLWMLVGIILTSIVVSKIMVGKAHVVLEHEFTVDDARYQCRKVKDIHE